MNVITRRCRSKTAVSEFQSEHHSTDTVSSSTLTVFFFGVNVKKGALKKGIYIYVLVKMLNK